jgi:hypothetical protein
MVARAYTVAFDGIEARMVEVQCAVTTGLASFTLVGLPDKARHALKLKPDHPIGAGQMHSPICAAAAAVPLAMPGNTARMA